MSEPVTPSRMDELADFQRRSYEEQIKKSNHHLEIELWAIVRDALPQIMTARFESQVHALLGDLARNAFNLGKKHQ